jgi:hypothetical protein
LTKELFRKRGHFFLPGFLIWSVTGNWMWSRLQWTTDRISPKFDDHTNFRGCEIQRYMSLAYHHCSAPNIQYGCRLTVRAPYLRYQWDVIRLEFLIGPENPCLQVSQVQWYMYWSMRQRRPTLEIQDGSRYKQKSSLWNSSIGRCRSLTRRDGPLWTLHESLIWIYGIWSLSKRKVVG